MSGLLNLAKRYPARSAAIVVVLIGWLGPVGVPGFIVAGLLTIVGILQGGPAVHDVVTPVASAVTTVNAAAEAAAKTTAERLTSETVGARGEITGTALGIATEAAAGAADDALTVLGVSRKDRITA